MALITIAQKQKNGNVYKLNGWPFCPTRWPLCPNVNNNHNNNSRTILYHAVIMLKALQEFTLVHVMNAAQCQVPADLWTKPLGLNHKPASTLPLPVNYTHHRHFIITEPES